jgi:hypothetical protein
LAIATKSKYQHLQEQLKQKVIFYSRKNYGSIFLFTLFRAATKLLLQLETCCVFAAPQRGTRRTMGQLRWGFTFSWSGRTLFWTFSKVDCSRCCPDIWGASWSFTSLYQCIRRKYFQNPQMFVTMQPLSLSREQSTLNCVVFNIRQQFRSH